MQGVIAVVLEKFMSLAMGVVLWKTVMLCTTDHV
jgi:hypothetical protein